MNYKHSAVALVVLAALAGCGSDDNELDGKEGNSYPPQASNVAIPSLHVGQTVEGMYNYLDPNASPREEGNSQYAWRDDAEELLGTTQEMFLDYEHHNRNIQFCVTPVAQGTANTTGKEACSVFKKVGDQLGEPPVAENVTVDNMAPQVGETLEGSYDYSHPDSIEEGSSEIVWRADGQAISGANTATLELEAAVTEGRTIDFCVTPKTNQNPPLIGEQVCSDATAPVTPKAGSAPVAGNVAVNGDAFVGANLTGTYDFTDVDGDQEGNSQFSWERDDVKIEGAIETTYLATLEDKDTYLSFCVKPVSATGTPAEGAEECVKMDTQISVKEEEAPNATDVKINGSPELGETVTGSYVYDQSEGSPEGTSIAHWKLGGAQQADCTTAQSCSFTVDIDDLGKTLEYCVMPRTALGTPADDYTCSGTVDTKGIKLTGALEYDNTLTAIAYGYSEDLNTNGRWMIDSSNQNGPDGDANKTEQAKGNSYKIGVRKDVANDYDWFAAGPDTVDARNFIGKSVEFCLDKDDGGEVCVNAAAYEDVAGGVYYNASDASLRAIESIREVAFGDRVYHRPLTLAETQLKDAAGFGSGIVDAHQGDTINGIEWALFNHADDDESGADIHGELVGACRNLYTTDGEWHVPMGIGGSSYTSNYYEAKGNNPPELDTESSLRALAENVITGNNDDAYHMSPVFGWPVSNSKNSGIERRIYTTSSYHNTNNKFYAVRFYSNSTATSSLSVGGYLSCVK